jgi:hypothetical protein
MPAHCVLSTPLLLWTSIITLGKKIDDEKTLLSKKFGFTSLRDVSLLGVVHKLRGQDEVGRWSVKCPRLST